MGIREIAINRQEIEGVNLDPKNIFEWLWIVSCFGCGSNRIWDYMAEFPDVSAACETIRSSEKRKSFLTDTEIRSAERVSEEQVNELISYCMERNIYILTCDDEIYPDKFRSIYNPPALLFCRGNVEYIRDEFCLSVVGTRKPAPYSVRLTEALIGDLAGRGITIASGFAVGIDIAANLSALRKGGRTIAVLGCGLDHDYPKENIIYREIIEKNGLFISEYFPKFTGNSRSFPARNRILSALSLGTIVIEAGLKSGSLSTANHALSQGRDVFAAAPHDLFDVRYGGNVELIRGGATCLCGVNDILYEYYENYRHKLSNTVRSDHTKITEEIPEEGTGSGKNIRKSEMGSPAKKTRSEKSVNRPKPERSVKGSEAAKSSKVSGTKKEHGSVRKRGRTVRKQEIPAFEGDQARVYDFLINSKRAVLADELAAELEMDIPEMLEILTDLELEGAVTSSAGGYSANMDRE